MLELVHNKPLDELLAEVKLSELKPQKDTAKPSPQKQPQTVTMWHCP